MPLHTTQSKPGVKARRSQRVLLRMPVMVYGRGKDSAPFREETFTQVVNAHGALILLKAQVANGQKLMLTNNATNEEQECKVVYVGPGHEGKAEIGVEFTRPAPQFWHIAFPPEDWRPLLD